MLKFECPFFGLETKFIKESLGYCCKNCDCCLGTILNGERQSVSNIYVVDHFAAIQIAIENDILYCFHLNKVKKVKFRGQDVIFESL